MHHDCHCGCGHDHSHAHDCGCGHEHRHAQGGLTPAMEEFLHTCTTTTSFRWPAFWWRAAWRRISAPWPLPRSISARPTRAWSR